jgi:hypothetical protein
MTHVSTHTNEGNEGRCPFCGNTVRMPYATVLTDMPCPSCGSLYWYVCVENKAFAYNRESMSLEGWDNLQKNIPQKDDDSTVFVEKLIYLESVESD